MSVWSEKLLDLQAGAVVESLEEFLAVLLQQQVLDLGPQRGITHQGADVEANERGRVGRREGDRVFQAETFVDRVFGRHDLGDILAPLRHLERQRLAVLDEEEVQGAGAADPR
jgi:hypothetical protein